MTGDNFKFSFKYGFDKESGMLMMSDTGVAGDVMHRAAVQMAYLKDKKFEECLVAMGWTPPDGAPNVPAAMTLKKYQNRTVELEDVLRKIANIDYRGNRSSESQMAYKALNAQEDL